MNFYHRDFTEADLETFEALCFQSGQKQLQRRTQGCLRRRAFGTKRLLGRSLSVHAKIRRKQFTKPMRQTPSAVPRPLRMRSASLCDGPGCIPSLISVYGPDRDGKANSFECNIMHERGGAINSTFSVFYGCGLTCDHILLRGPFGKGSSVRFSTDHLTDEGVEFAKWLFSERIEALRRRE